MKAKRLRGLLMQVAFNWLNNGKFKGSDTDEKPLLLKVVEGNNKTLIVEVASGFAAETDVQLYEVTIKVKKMGKR